MPADADVTALKPSVLVIEDEYDLRLDLAEFFVDSGWRVETAATGREAVLKLDSSHLDVWIVDLRLPDIDGLELLDRLRQRADRPATIVLTSSLADEDLVGSLQRGCDLFLNKSASLEAIRTAAENLKRRSRCAPEQRPTWELTGRALQHRPSGATTKLTPSERCLLATLGRRPEESVPRDTLIESLNRPAGSSIQLEVIISRLRRKLESSFERPPEIIPLYGVGYMIDTAIAS
jgi:DNA-binding response OmpR family regulator